MAGLDESLFKMKKRIIERFLSADKRAVIEELRAQGDLNIQALKSMDALFLCYQVFPIIVLYAVIMLGSFFSHSMVIAFMVTVCVFPLLYFLANKAWGAYVKPYLSGRPVQGIIKKVGYACNGHLSAEVINIETNIQKRVDLSLIHNRKDIKKGHTVSYFECDMICATLADPISLQKFCLKKFC